MNAGCLLHNRRVCELYGSPGVLKECQVPSVQYPLKDALYVTVVLLSDQGYNSNICVYLTIETEPFIVYLLAKLQ